MEDDVIRVEEKGEESDRAVPAGITLRSFIEQTPPDTEVLINDLTLGTNAGYLQVPEVLLYCENPDCEGTRMFKARDSLYVNTDWSSKFLEFVCRNCGKRLYRYAFVYRVVKMPTKESNGTASMMKMGQIPAFGPKTPARVLRLIQSDRELFLQGRRAENRGLGIGAFAYYRRVVENQRNRIIQEIAKAAKVVGTTAEIDSLFIEALNQFQFSKSVEMLEGFIPQALLIRGENPLVLLHSALSKGLHSPEMTDEHCLELAQSIRIVLTELAERVSSVTKDDKEIQEALKVLKGIPRGSKSNDQIVAEKPLDTIPSISMGEFQSEGARELTSTAEPVEAEARFIPPY